MKISVKELFRLSKSPAPVTPEDKAVTFDVLEGKEIISDVLEGKEITSDVLEGKAITFDVLEGKAITFDADRGSNKVYLVKKSIPGQEWNETLDIFFRGICQAWLLRRRYPEATRIDNKFNSGRRCNRGNSV